MLLFHFQVSFFICWCSPSVVSLTLFYLSQFVYLVVNWYSKATVSCCFNFAAISIFRVRAATLARGKSSKHGGQSPYTVHCLHHLLRLLGKLKVAPLLVLFYPQAGISDISLPICQLAHKTITHQRKSSYISSLENNSLATLWKYLQFSVFTLLES